jgi:geranylgeranyl reductase family protein
MDHTAFSDHQPPAGSLGESSWDVVIVGAGPAGSVAAGVLARGGLRTLLVDRERFPRDKTCGDGLNLDALRLLQGLGLREEVEREGRRLQRARVLAADGTAVVVEGPFVNLERRRLDERLVSWATGGGAAFALGRTRRIRRRDGGGYRIEVDEPRAALLEATFVIVATGADTALAESLGLAARRPPSAAASRLYVRSRAGLDEILGVYAPCTLPGYGWIFPLPDDLFNVGVITFYRRGRRPGPPLSKRLDAFLERCPAVRELLRQGEISGHRRTAPLRCGLPDPAHAGREGALAVGEAIGTTLPLTGEGVGKAIESGRMAAEAVLEAAREGWPVRAGAAYATRLEGLGRRYAVYALGERGLGRPRINRWLARQARKHRSLRRALEAVVVRERGLADLFALRGPARLNSS